MAKHPWLKPATMTAGLLPFAVLFYEAWTGGLGANPIESGLNQLGKLALVLLWATLACTPIRIATKAAWPLAIRKTLGLLAFFYATLHLLVYAVLDKGLALGAIGADISQRVFILVGFVAWLLMVPLAATSTKAMLQQLGAKRWRRLHMLVYACGVFGALHYIWRVKADLLEPLLYTTVLLVLFAMRIAEAAKKRKKRAARVG